MRGLALGLALLGLAAPVAQAGNQGGAETTPAAQPSPDAVDRYLMNVLGELERYLWRVPPAERDTIDRYLASMQVGLAGYLGVNGAPGAAAATGESTRAGMPDGYQPQLREPAAPLVRSDTPDGYQPQLREPAALPVRSDTPDGYQPQLRESQPAPSLVSTGGGFDWADAGIGAGVAFGLVLLFAAGALAARAARSRVAHP